MKSRLLTNNYQRFTFDDEIPYDMPDGYYTIDSLADCDESDAECDIDEVWLQYNNQTLLEYIAIAFETVAYELIKVFHRSSSSCKLSLKREADDDGIEAVIVHSNGMIQLYPNIYEDDEYAGDISHRLSEFFNYEDVEYGGSIGGDAYLVSNGKMYEYTKVT